LGTAISKYDGLDSSTQIDVKIYGGHLKFAMRLIYLGFGVVYNGQRQVWGQMILVPKDPCPCWNVKLKLLYLRGNVYERFFPSKSGGTFLTTQ
jgi:hypothetical protein